MAIPRLIFLPRARTHLPALLLASAICLPSAARATGGFDDTPPPTLPFYLDRLPAKPPALIFQETYGGPTTAAKPIDFKGALLALAGDCEKGRPAATLLATTDALLTQARLNPGDAAALCNILNDVRDLFASAPPVIGQPAAGYIRWRVDHAGWFHLDWSGKKPADAYEDEDAVQKRRAETAKVLDGLAADPAAGPLRVHWLYLCGASEFPAGGAERFQQVADQYPDHPRAEAARFMLARCLHVSSRSHNTGYTEPSADDTAAAQRERDQARAAYLDYLKRYPKGRFVADVPGWLGGLAFDEADYLHALSYYIQQADVPGHPEVLKSAGFMCERCLSMLSATESDPALEEVATHPRLAMSLIYLVVSSPEAKDDDSGADDPARVTRWRRALLPRLAAAVAARKDLYAGADWQPRYLAILAQAASGDGDQAKALAICDVGKDQLAHSDDLAFIRLVALSRARRLPEAIAAGRDFAKSFPASPLAPGASLRLALALQDNHQAGAAVGELSRLSRAVAAQAERVEKSGEDPVGASGDWDVIYPSADANLSASRSVLLSDTSGAEARELDQITDALLNFAPLPELAAVLAPGGGKPESGLDAAGEATLRAVLVQRWLAEEENFAEAHRYATPAQWDVAAATLEKLTADVTSAAAGEARAAACARLAEGWVAARGKLLFAPLETDETRALFSGGADRADILRRENALALGLAADRVDHALTGRDEWAHAFAWWSKSADAAAAGSPTEARALWGALRVMPAVALASPYTFLHAGQTDASALSRRLYDRLRRDCAGSREAREFAVYYDLAPPAGKAPEGDTGATGEQKPPEPDLSAAISNEHLPNGEPEYRWSPVTDDGLPPEEDPPAGHDEAMSALLQRAIALGAPAVTAHPPQMVKQVAQLRAKLAALPPQLEDLFLVNFLDDLADFLGEPAAKLTPPAVARYVKLRLECLSIEHWTQDYGDTGLPPVPDATPDTLNETVFAHIRAAYRAPEMQPFKDYLDVMAMAIIANENIQVPVPGETQDDKSGEEGKKEPVTYTSRDYPKLAKLCEGFLVDYPHSRKREAVRLLYARALYRASRPHCRERFAVWPQSGHFASGSIIVTDRQEPFDPRKIGAALNAYDREFPGGRYAGDIRNLRGILAWRTQDWPLALSLTFQTLADAHEPSLQAQARQRLVNIFMDGLIDETERAACLAAIKKQPGAPNKLREFLPRSPYPLQAMRTWALAQL